MAETEIFIGRIGLESRDRGTLEAAVSVAVDLLEEFGHPADTFEARAENTAKLLCDHYLITIKLRSVPLRRASRLSGSIMQPSALLEMSLAPVHPDYCDQEITELLLAEMLRRVLPEVEATSVEWLDSEVALTCEQFLSAFDGRPADAIQPTAESSGEAGLPAAHAGLAAAALPAAASRPRGRACFTPVDETAEALENHCDLAFEAARVRQKAKEAAQSAELAGFISQFPERRPRLNWTSQLRASAAAALTFSSPRRLRLISHLLLLAALILYLESAGMVQAARPLIP